MYTQHTIIIKKVKKTSLNDIHLPPGLALWLTLSGSNNLCLEQINIVRNMFELLRFDCKYLMNHKTLVNWNVK